MKNIDLPSSERRIYDTNQKPDSLSRFLAEYSSESQDKQIPENDPVTEIIRGIRKLNEILEELNLQGKKNFMTDWISPEQLRQKLGISERTLATWRKSGKLPYSRIKQKLFYKIQDVENLLME